MTIFRRFLVLLVLFFWQGGFVFYSAVVIHISRTELGPRSKATVITTKVTYYLNLAGMASMVPLLWDVFAPDVSRRRRWLRGGLWALLLLTLAAQLFLYGELKRLVEPILAGENPPTFPPAHKAFLWASTVQIAASIGYLITSLLAWRARRPRRRQRRLTTPVLRGNGSRRRAPSRSGRWCPASSAGF